MRVEWGAIDQLLAEREGWWLSNDSDGCTEIQALDDDVVVFANDDEAWEHVRSFAAAGSKLHQRALLVVVVEWRWS